MLTSLSSRSTCLRCTINLLADSRTSRSSSGAIWRYTSTSKTILSTRSTTTSHSLSSQQQWRQFRSAACRREQQATDRSKEVEGSIATEQQNFGIESPPPLDPEAVAIGARREFGNVLPEGLLSEEEFNIYVRLFGKPLRFSKQGESSEDESLALELQRTGQDGSSYEGVELAGQDGSQQGVELAGQDFGVQQETEMEENVAEEDIRPIEVLEDDWPDEDDYVRSHPYTVAGRFSTSPSTIQLPKPTFTTPIAELLSPVSTSHIIRAAQRAFGGPGLPYSPSTPKISRTMKQKPIALNSSQSRMPALDADAYLACVMPQTYASLTSVLVEVRKRLGSEWLRELLSRDDGPLMLDAGAGGAGVLAWRDILKAEWESIRDDDSGGGGDDYNTPIPLGRATVVTGSDNLRHRASRLLENTTFIPRLPDHVAEPLPEKASPRKQYDIILAPHTLWPLKDDYRRKSFVESLWSLLNPQGGVLVILEKGVPRGFEVVAGAREFLLNRYISSPGSLHYQTHSSSIDRQSPKDALVQKEPGMIVAPCTNHVACPLYKAGGVSRGRKDWCYFSQRYIRPPFLQTMLGAKSRNHDDVEFSYLAVRRGLDMRQDTNGPVQGPEATEKAFGGFGVQRHDEIQEDQGEEGDGQPATHDSLLDFFTSHKQEPEVIPEANEASVLRQQIDDEVANVTEVEPPHPLSLPRTLLTPLKRKGHILIDVCTPSGSLERWIVNRKCGKQVFRDARKAKWGDLWALGAKGRSPRRVNVGEVEKALKKKGKDKKNMRQMHQDEDD